jgi:23S rRNA (guanine745-N1)-methyltransferase
VLADVTHFLRCPVCRGSFRHGGSALVCSSGHGFDIARQGYVNLLTGGAAHRDADTPAMVDARDRFLAGGHYAPLADVLAERSRQVISELAGDVCVLDAGAGTGYYLARVLDACAGPPGIALDRSKHAARRAARAHARTGAVVADVWERFPVRSGAAGVALVVFAPRNPPELHRVLNGRGRLIVVTPAPAHLQEITGPLGLLRVDENKAELLSARLEPLFAPAGRQTLERRLRLGEAALRALAMMGPSAWHTSPEELDERIDGLGGAADVTTAFTISAYRPLSR